MCFALCDWRTTLCRGGGGAAITDNFNLSGATCDRSNHFCQRDMVLTTWILNHALRIPWEATLLRSNQPKWKKGNQREPVSLNGQQPSKDIERSPTGSCRIWARYRELEGTCVAPFSVQAVPKRSLCAQPPPPFVAGGVGGYSHHDTGEEVEWRHLMLYAKREIDVWCVRCNVQCTSSARIFRRVQTTSASQAWAPCGAPGSLV